MSHITEVSVTGLAGRDRVYRQVLNRDINVFFGLNGSGKTSLLKIMHSAMSNDASILASVPFQHAEVKLYSVNHKAEITRRIAKSESERERKGKKSSKSVASDEISDELSPENKPMPVLRWVTQPKSQIGRKRYAHTYLPTYRLLRTEGVYYPANYERLSYPYSSALEVNSSEEALDIYFARSLERLWTAYSADVLSEVNKAQQIGLASILKAVLSTRQSKETKLLKISPETAYNRAATFLERQGSKGILGPLEEFSEQYKEDPKLRRIVSDINEVEQGIEKAMAPRNRLQSLVRKMFGETKVELQDQSIKITARDKTKIDLTGLSSGQKHVLKIFIESLLVEESSLMIDEPEISMHIDWQKILIASMQQLNPSAQIIVATHSPEIMADIPDDKIFHL